MSPFCLPAFFRMSGRRYLFRANWMAVAILWLMFALAVTSAAQKSPTFDEQGFITRGLAYLRGDHRHIRVGHPLGLNALNAAFLVADRSVVLPVDHPSWQGQNFHRPSELFLWEIGNNVEKISFVARLPTIWLAMLLAVVAGRWARELSGSSVAGLIALLLIGLDPNILAHGRLATTDLGLTATATLAGFTLWRLLLRPTWRAALAAGVALGFMLNTKFTALLFLPLFALLALIALLRVARYEPRRLAFRAAACWLFFYPLAAFLTLWAAYGFSVGRLPPDLPFLPELAGLPVPMPHYGEQLLDIGGRAQKATPAFLMGSYSDSGWWYYFPVAFLLKTPLPLLLLLTWAITSWLLKPVESRKLSAFSAAALLIPAAGFMAIAMTSTVNLGYRLILPVLPFLVVFTAVNVIPGDRRQGNGTAVVRRLPLAILLIWFCLSSLAIYPHFLAYFNRLAGGPDNGWRYLIDSNLDWGQDLAGLQRWLATNEVEHVWLSYFGEARPDYYGIKYTGLDSFPPRLMNPAARPFYPFAPAPGFYAISATNLVGISFQDRDLYAWFRDRQPMARVGYSIFVYQVAATGPQVELALANVQPDEISPDLLKHLQTNDVRSRWFLPDSALLLAHGSDSWMVLPDFTVHDPRLKPYRDAILTAVAHRQGLSLYRVHSDWRTAWEPLLAHWTGRGEVPFCRDESCLTLVNWQLHTPEVVTDNELAVLTLWQYQGAPQPVKMFVHLLDQENQIQSQWDRSDVAWEGWQSGDMLLQLHRLSLPETLAPGNYAVWIGLYHPDKLVRWRSAASDRHFIGEVIVP
jgi:hypothetical protein